MSRQDIYLPSADKPVGDPEKDDLLGYAPFVKNLADGFCKLTTPDGLVVAINGPWGSGKSTVLLFARSYLEQKPKKERPIIMEFNPWWFSGREDLTRLFFDQLLATISKWRLGRRWLRWKTAGFVDLVSYAPIPGAKTGKPIGQWIRAYKSNVSDLKLQMAKILRKNGRRVLIIIDDVDRLAPGEMRDMFRLVKAIADFPNVLYLMAFDKQVVANALSTAEGGSGPSYGASYIEKIVQLPVEMPVPDPIALQKMFARHLSNIITDKSVSLFDKTYWREVYLEGVDHFLNTPRDVVRLANALKLIYPTVEGEVNPVDYFAMEALRLFRPSVYEKIRAHTSKFVGATPREQRDELTAFHNAWLEELDEDPNGPVGRMLRNMFPKFESAFRNVHYEVDGDWRRQLRACSPDKIAIYFRFCLPGGEISREELRTLLGLASDSHAFGTALLELSSEDRPDGLSRVSQALEQLSDSGAADFEEETIPFVVRSLLDVGDELVRREDRAGLMFEIRNIDRIVFLLTRLLARVNELHRFGALQDSISSGRALSTIVELVSTLGDEHGKYSGSASPEERRLVTHEQLERLEEEACRRIVDAAQDGRLLDTPQLPVVLYRWKDWGAEEDLASWVSRVVQDDRDLLTFLQALIPDNEIYLIRDPISDLRERRYLERVRSFVNISDLHDRIELISRRTDLTEKDRIRLRLILEG